MKSTLCLKLMRGIPLPGYEDLRGLVAATGIEPEANEAINIINCRHGVAPSRILWRVERLRAQEDIDERQNSFVKGITKGVWC